MKTKPVSLKQVSVKGGFWGPRADQAREIILPFQWEVMNDRVPGAAKSAVIKNFKIAAGKAKGEFHGFVFQDSDFGKWSEGVAYSLMTHPDPALEKKCDAVIDLLEQVGYRVEVWVSQCCYNSWSKAKGGTADRDCPCGLSSSWRHPPRASRPQRFGSC